MPDMRSPRERFQFDALGRARRRLPADDGDQAYAVPRQPPQIVRQPDLGVLDLSVPRLAAELEPHLVHHPQPARADRMSEALQPAVRIHRLSPLEHETALERILPAFAARRKA